MQANFSVEESVGGLWTKLDGWLDAIILKLPNKAAIKSAISIKAINRLCCKFLTKNLFVFPFL
jgi:small conductance mechanosensitive channel